MADPRFRDLPIRIGKRRGLAVAFVLAGAALTALDAWVLVYDPTAPARMKLELQVAPLLLVLALVQWLFPERLEIDADGLVRESALGRRHYRWHEISAITVQSVWGLARHVAFDFSPDDRGQGWLRAIMRFRTGRSATLGGGWQMPAAELAALLQATQSRWSKIQSR